MLILVTIGLVILCTMLAIFFITTLIPFLIMAILIVALLTLFFGRQSKSTRKTVRQTVDKTEQYKQAGLTDADIVVFRQTMGDAKEQIELVLNAIDTDAQLHAIDVELNLGETLKNYFATIVAQPKQFHKASKFLYSYLPTLADLVVKYSRNKKSLQQTSEGYAILTKAVGTIREIAQKISLDALQFMGTDGLEQDIVVAKHIIK